MSQEEIDDLNLIARAKAPTPKFFKKLRTIGLILAATSAAILAAPLSLPVAVTTAASYLAVAGSVATAISQVTVESGNE